MNPIFRILRNAATSAHAALYRASGGRVGASMIGLGVLLLTTTGSKSGQPRTTPLGFLPDGETYILVASNGGAAQHPAWYVNLRHHPRARIQVRDRTIEVYAETATGERRGALWTKVIADAPGYQGYARRTAREIPLVVLTPVA